MGIFIVSALIGLLVFLLFLRADWIISLALGVFIFIFSAIYLSAITITFYVNSDIGRRQLIQTEIYSLNFGEKLSGQFILSSGSVESKEYYYYFVSAYGGFIKESIPTDKVIIIESDCAPHIEYYDRHIENWWDNYTIRRDGKVKMYVPKNTIIREFKVN